MTAEAKEREAQILDLIKRTCGAQGGCGRVIYGTRDTFDTCKRGHECLMIAIRRTGEEIIYPILTSPVTRTEE